MQAIKKIVNRTAIKAIDIPEEYGDKVEIIVLPLEEKEKLSIVSEKIMRLEEKTAFATQILGDTSEDVWNDI